MTPNDLKAARREAEELLNFIDASPSPFHACAEAAARLKPLGFVELDEQAAWPAKPGRYYVIRSGSIVAWAIPANAKPWTGARIVGAHTDSPNLRIKPKPDTGAAGYRQLGVDVYGGVLHNSWLNRELGLSGRAVVKTKSGRETRLFKIDRPCAVLPQLAIHLDRSVNDNGLVLDKQAHLTPIWGLGRPRENEFKEWLANELSVAAENVVAWDAMLHDVQPSSFAGASQEFVAAPRLDNLNSCFCALRGFVQRLEETRELAHVAVVCLFDHEEVGSTSHRGAASPLLKDALERIVLGRGGTREDYHRAIAASVCVSADMAHALHPNYREKYEPDHWVALNAGPAIKINVNTRYATDAEGEAHFAAACERAGVPFQRYVHRSNLACGTTIGPVTAANLGIVTLDVGNPELSMHSAREFAGAHDPWYLAKALAAFFE
ncbi:MAG: M18 family aminopeptidase [Planctomycetes bacterium]|nr:M18 family aminopeptidase [Planctomycetota bacterium]